MNIWLLILAMALVTWLQRASFLLQREPARLPPLMQRALRFVPVAVLTALIVPMALAPQGTLWLSWHNPSLLGLIACLLVAWRWRRLLPALLVGALVYGVLRAI